jgi:hypothetical protein
MSRRSVANGSGGVSADGVRRVGVLFAMDNGLQQARDPVLAAHGKDRHILLEIVCATYRSSHRIAIKAVRL